MSRVQIYSLGGFDYTGKEAVKRQAQSILKAYSPGQYLSDRDEAFVRDLLEWHPSASQKIGIGVARIGIHTPKPWNSKGFFLERVDGSRTDFSYRICLNPKLADNSVKFLAACRRAVSWEISEFKRASFAESSTVWCPIEGREIDWFGAHVDHYPTPFIDLVERYIQLTGIDPCCQSYADGDGEVETRFADQALERNFAKWHRENAKLRIVSGSANIRLGAHGRSA